LRLAHGTEFRRNLDTSSSHGTQSLKLGGIFPRREEAETAASLNAAKEAICGATVARFLPANIRSVATYYQSR
jgi:hypothetical protein